MVQKHHLFIATWSPDGIEAASNVLIYLKAAKPWLSKMGVQIEVNKLTAKHRDDSAFRASCLKKGITSFPAMKTPNKLFIGAKQITESYTMVIEKYKEQVRNVAPPPPSLSALGAAGADLHREFYKDEMSFRAAERDTGEDVLGDGGSKAMMSRFHERLTRRQVIDDKRSKRKADAPSLPAAPAGPSGALSDKTSMDGLISKAAGPVTQDTLDRAFADEGGSDDPHEDIMMKAFWTNQSETEM